VKTKKSLKKAAQRTAEEIGMPLGTLINSFLKQFVRTKEVSFSASREYPSASLRRAIAEGERELRAGKLKPMTLEELKKDLLS